MVPGLEEEDVAAVAEAAGRLSCVDERFGEFAGSLGVESGPLAGEERERLRIEIDARVARAWGLTADELETLLAEFHPRRRADPLPDPAPGAPHWLAATRD